MPELAPASPLRRVSDGMTLALPAALAARGSLLSAGRRDAGHLALVALASDWLRLVGAVYLMRCMTVTLTSLPGPAPHCQPGAVSRGEYAPPANWHEIATTTLSSIGGRTCGDLLFSGHAAVATVTTLLLVRTQRPDAARVAASTYLSLIHI